MINKILFLLLILPITSYSDGFVGGIDSTHRADTSNPHSIAQSDIQTGFVEEISGQIETVDDQDYTLVGKAQYARQIVSIAIKCASGTVTAGLEIDSTNITTCTSISVTDSEQEVTCDTGVSNDLAASETLDLEMASNSSCLDLWFVIKTTRD